MQGVRHGGRQVLAEAVFPAGLRRQHEAIGHGHAEFRHPAQLPAFAARGPGTGQGRGCPVQHEGSHAAPSPVAPRTKRLIAASNSALRLAPGRSSQRSIAPR
ncbi:hypothetical protein D3C86_1003390 [compost metagenome]